MFKQCIDHIYPLLAHTDSLFPIYAIMFPASCPILFLIFVIVAPHVQLACPHAHGCVCGIHWSMSDLPGATSPPIGVGPLGHIPIHSGILASLILCSNHSCYELMHATGMSFPEATISQLSSPSSDSYILPISSSTKSSEPWMVRC